jgi:SAM-dependent methyltransferase
LKFSFELQFEVDRTPAFRNWLEDLEKRHLADLRFSDAARALRALSSAYVERRASGLARHRDLDGVGKRAAFALYYGPLHFLLVQSILRELAPEPAPGVVLDLGCGSGAAGAAVTTAMSASSVSAIDTHPWALDEARLTYRAFGLAADVRRGDATRIRPPRGTSFVVAGFVVNEVGDAARAALLETVLDASRTGVAVLIVEPISRRVSPWWPEWEKAFVTRGGRADEWRFPTEVPPIVRRLARATGLHPEVMTARSLFVGKLPGGGLTA